MVENIKIKIKVLRVQCTVLIGRSMIVNKNIYQTKLRWYETPADIDVNKIHYNQNTRSLDL